MINTSFSNNYEKCYKYVEQVLRQELSSKGKDTDFLQNEIVELSESVLGDVSLVERLVAQDFTVNGYDTPVREAIARVRAELMPDVCKRRFVSVEGTPIIHMLATPDDVSEDAPQAPVDIEEKLAEMLDQPAHEYVQKFIVPNLEQPEIALRFLAQPANRPKKKTLSELANARIDLIRRLYPAGCEKLFTARPETSEHSEETIQQIYFRVHLGIERSFPANFLTEDGEYKSRVLIQTLVETILESSPEALIEENDESLLLRYGLQNVYRYFNYSLNRVLRNAYPDRVPPWMNSRSGANYWEQKDNRIQAVRWLVEDRLGHSPEALHRASISRNSFASNGLSFVFNSYYNSVAKALSEAYPEKQPWELGKVPYSFWNTETSAQAVRWVVSCKGWNIEDIPAMVRDGSFNRKTFSEFGLATLFEKRFSRNIFRAVDAAWPGRVQQWEIGKVPSAYWRSAANILHASKWIAKREGVDDSKIVPAIRQRQLHMGMFSNYSIGAALKRLCNGNIERLYQQLFLEEHLRDKDEARVLKQLNSLRRKQVGNSLLELLGYGLFWNDVQRNSDHTRQRCDRVSNRIHRRRRMAE